MSPSRQGITRVEVVVVLVIAVLVLGLIVSGLVRTREGASAVQCANNLRLMGAAVHQVRAKNVKDVLAKKGAAEPLAVSRIADGYGTWGIQITPYIVAKSKLLEWDLQKPYADQEPAVRETPLTVFFCPARSRSDLLSTVGDVAPGALGDYACASADGDPQFPFDSDKANGAIIPAEVLERKEKLILRWRSRTDFQSLKRGASNTILIGEKHVPLGKFGQVMCGDGSLFNGAHPASFARVGGPGFGLAHAPADPFNTNFGSYHPGICQFLMGDASIRTMKNGVDENILGQLIRRE